jgi:hypothetical protein
VLSAAVEREASERAHLIESGVGERRRRDHVAGGTARGEKVVPGASQALATDVRRSEAALTPNVLNESAIIQTFSGGGCHFRLI